MATVASRIVRPNEVKIWFAKAEVWPIIFCIGGASVWLSYMGGRYLTSSPNTTSLSSRQERAGAKIKDNESRGVEWRAASAHHVAKDSSKIRIFGSFEHKSAATVGKALA